MRIGIFKAFRLFSILSSGISLAAKDNKITIKEAISIIEDVCKELGIDFDQTGYNLVRIIK